ncbi:hypothetical protein ACTG9Q_20945 [Actinokineospora sp. 24-640]
MPFAIGPVGIIAVALGAGGVLLGLLRRRRDALAAGKGGEVDAVSLPGPREPVAVSETT